MQGLTGNVLITGGAGFLARGIYRRARAEGWDASFTCLSRDDAKHAALQRRFPEVQTVLGDVGMMSVERLADLMRGFDLVIHAAASKYVERAEHAAFDTIRTNTLGSMNVAEAAVRARVPRVVGISTDKAVQPVNNYGASKLLMERVMQEANRLSRGTTFTACRYGNVIGSTGSVLYLFTTKLANGEPIQLTDGNMTRFWMTVDEAVDVILQSIEAPGGSVVIPSCKALSMHDVAAIALGYCDRSEYEASDNSGRLETVGLRPGEKMHEALLQEQESVRAVRVASEGDPAVWEWLHLAPPDSLAVTSQPFAVVSNDPPGGWMPYDEMRAATADAMEV